MFQNYQIRTVCLREALASSSFSNTEDRHRIGELQRLENYLDSNVKGMAANMSLGILKAKYPVEALRMIAELKEGRVLSLEEAVQQVYRREEVDLELKRLSHQHKMSEEASARSAWTAAGGLP